MSHTASIGLNTNGVFQTPRSPPVVGTLCEIAALHRGTPPLGRSLVGPTSGESTSPARQTKKKMAAPVKTFIVFVFVPHVSF